MVVVKKLPKYIWNPVVKKLMPNPAIKKPKRTRRERWLEKHRRNLIGCYPWYIFTINGQEYICTDSTDIPRPINPIPVRIYPSADNPKDRVMLKSIVPEEKY